MSSLRDRMRKKAAEAKSAGTKSNRSRPATVSELIAKKARTEDLVVSATRARTGGSLTKKPPSVRTAQLSTDDSKFGQALSKTSLTVFHRICDLGYYKWNLPEDWNGSYKMLKEVVPDDIIANIDLYGMPSIALSVPSMIPKLPVAFASHIPPQEYQNKFPFNPSYLSSLHVAKVYRGVKLENVDFMFGGSTLEFIAGKDISHNKKVLAMMIPGTRIILVASHRQNEMNLADPGYQFERFATDNSFNDLHGTSTVEHLQLMHVGGHKILFAAEVDAIDADNKDPIEMKSTKASNTQYWGTRVLFQMISNGSCTLYFGEKSISLDGYSELQAVHELNLVEVATNAFQNQSATGVEKSIITSLNNLKDAAAKEVFDAGEIFELSFNNSLREMQLFHSTHEPGTVLLPPAPVVMDLLDLEDE